MFQLLIEFSLLLFVKRVDFLTFLEKFALILNYDTNRIIKAVEEPTRGSAFFCSFLTLCLRAGSIGLTLFWILATVLHAIWTARRRTRLFVLRLNWRAGILSLSRRSLTDRTVTLRLSLVLPLSLRLTLILSLTLTRVRRRSARLLTVRSLLLTRIRCWCRWSLWSVLSLTGRSVLLLTLSSSLSEILCWTLRSVMRLALAWSLVLDLLSLVRSWAYLNWDLTGGSYVSCRRTLLSVSSVVVFSGIWAARVWISRIICGYLVT